MLSDDARGGPEAAMRGGPEPGPDFSTPAGDPIGGVEAARLFERVFAKRGRVLLGVSGGADSTALLVLAAEWTQGARGPDLLVACVDHGLRPEAGAEIAAVAALAARLRLPFARLAAPVARETGVEEAARDARYAALEAHAGAVGAEAVAVAHTLDDQAETVLMRLCAGSGPAGLRAMGETSRRGGLTILRPFLGVPKARLVASLKQRGVAFASDPMNADLRFARARLRAGRTVLDREGLTAERLATLAFRMARVEAALEQATEAALAAHVARDGETWTIGAGAAAVPDEIKLRLLARVLAEAGGGAARLERLERLADRIVTRASGAATLGGAKVVWTQDGRIAVRREPSRRRGAPAAQGL